MKLNPKFAGATLALLLTFASGALPLVASAQELNAEPAAEKSERKRGGLLGAIFGSGAQKKDEQKKPKKGKDDARPAPAQTGADERLEADDNTVVRPDLPAGTLANRREQLSEEADSEIPYYNNFLTTYRLGPEDVISVEVFDKPRYSKAGITVPPDGKISYYLIPEGVNVVGKTTQQIAAEITRHLDEYIIDPKVTVSLDKAMSARYGVLGDVAQPGVRVMSRRVSVMEALLESGGVLQTGNKKKVTVMHWDADRNMKLINIDVAAIEKGQAQDNYFLRPGDQIFVPGNKWKTVDKVLKMLPVINFARIFTGGF
ncbi:MAG TPA: polysaccharide biosynthesis/export family protein [Pyrinomonadaceae bacterium]|jgi:polysaccharide export outer membrane protein|nr:polysaccharide biosynthesis/export family protein [Pyrinomonadaceae bacterium]